MSQFLHLQKQRHERQSAENDVMCKKEKTINTTLSDNEAREFITALNGKIISHVWRGYGSAIFLELGELIVDKKHKNPSGEFTIAIEWSWRIENKNSIMLGSWSEDEDINNITTILINHKVQNIYFFSRLKEIEIKLKENLWLSSYATAEGDPQWSIKNKTKWLYFKNGKFEIEENT